MYLRRAGSKENAPCAVKGATVPPKEMDTSACSATPPGASHDTHVKLQGRAPSSASKLASSTALAVECTAAPVQGRPPMRISGWPEVKSRPPNASHAGLPARAGSSKGHVYSSETSENCEAHVLAS